MLILVLCFETVLFLHTCCVHFPTDKDGFDEASFAIILTLALRGRRWR